MNMFNIDEVNAYLEGKIYDNIAEKWFYYPDKLGVVVQLEQLLSGDMLIYACLEKDGGGAFLSSFLNLLMVEDIQAIPAPVLFQSSDGLKTIAGKRGVLPLCEVNASVSTSYYTIVKCTHQDNFELSLLIYEFTQSLEVYLPVTRQNPHNRGWQTKIASLAESKLSYMIADIND